MASSDVWPATRRIRHTRPYHGPELVVSGGQTGVDRAALDAAMAAGLPVAGWCPRGCWAEDGRIPERYSLREAPLCRPCQRTLFNIRDSDGTLVLVCGRPRGGTALTATGGLRRKPRLVMNPSDGHAPDLIRRWLRRHHIRILNVGGSRASEDPQIYSLARELLAKLFQSPTNSG